MTEIEFDAAKEASPDCHICKGKGVYWAWTIQLRCPCTVEHEVDIDEVDMEKLELPKE